MEQFIKSLKIEEQVTLELRKLYEQYGFQKYRMGRFEPYELYAENKNFIGSEQIITFTDLDGRLLALKPDVTLSIVKNAKDCSCRNEKLYYTENVYRLSRQNREYREIGQLGLEVLGNVDLYATAEVLMLAMKSLQAIDQNFVLQVSQLCFIEGMLESFKLQEDTRHTLLGHIRSKNLGEFCRIVREKAQDPDAARTAEKFAAISGNFAEALAQAREICVCDSMRGACEELGALYDILSATGLADHLQLDFSVVSNIDYYSGIIFQGYVRKVPSSVLSGGRYDNLVHRFGKQIGAIGYALYLDSFGSYYKNPTTYDVDILLLYTGDDDFAQVAKAMEQLTAGDLRVRAERQVPNDLRYRKLYRMADGEPEEVREDA